MLDPRLLEFNYPFEGMAFVESHLGYHSDFRTGRRMCGTWVSGVAVGVYRVGQTPLFVIFVDTNGQEYIIEHEQQLTSTEIAESRRAVLLNLAKR